MQSESATEFAEGQYAEKCSASSIVFWGFKKNCLRGVVEEIYEGKEEKVLGSVEVAVGKWWGLQKCVGLSTTTEIFCGVVEKKTL